MLQEYNISGLANRNVEAREISGKLYVGLFNYISKSVLEFDPETQSNELAFGEYFKYKTCFC